jgi:DNA-binding Lrp family transcriptional regulator
MASKLDNVDILILHELSKDSTQSVKVLSEKLRLHPNTLSQRIKSLEQNKFIKRYTISFNPSDVGYSVKAFVMIRVRKNLASAENLLSEVSKIPVSSGIYRVVVGNLILSAIVSEVISSRFVIRKMLVPPQQYSPQNIKSRFQR